MFSHKEKKDNYKIPCKPFKSGADYKILQIYTKGYIQGLEVEEDF